MKAKGFTLIELMIVVAVLAILLAIAVPSYRDYIIHSNRTEAQTEMMVIADLQESYLFNARRYATSLTELSYSLPGRVAENYSSGLTASGATFTLTFTAIGDQASDGDLTLDNFGNKTPAAKW